MAIIEALGLCGAALAIVWLILDVISGGRL